MFAGSLDDSTLFYNLIAALAVGVAGVAFCTTGCFLGTLDLVATCMLGTVQFAVGVSTDRTDSLIGTGCGTTGVFAGSLDCSTLFYDLVTSLAVGVASVALSATSCFLGILNFGATCVIGFINFTVGIATNRTHSLFCTGCSAAGMIVVSCSHSHRRQTLQSDTNTICGFFYLRQFNVACDSSQTLRCYCEHMAHHELIISCVGTFRIRQDDCDTFGGEVFLSSVNPGFSIIQGELERYIVMHHVFLCITGGDCQNPANQFLSNGFNGVKLRILQTIRNFSKFSLLNLGFHFGFCVHDRQCTAYIRDFIVASSIGISNSNHIVACDRSIRISSQSGYLSQFVTSHQTGYHVGQGGQVSANIDHLVISGDSHSSLSDTPLHINRTSVIAGTLNGQLIFVCIGCLVSGYLVGDTCA